MIANNSYYLKKQELKKSEIITLLEYQNTKVGNVLVSMPEFSILWNVF